MCLSNYLNLFSCPNLSFVLSMKFIHALPLYLQIIYPCSLQKNVGTSQKFCASHDMTQTPGLSANI